MSGPGFELVSLCPIPATITITPREPPMLPLRARVDLGAMAMKGYSAFPQGPGLLKPSHQIVYCHIWDNRYRSRTLLQRCNRRFLQPQMTGPFSEEKIWPEMAKPLEKITNNYYRISMSLLIKNRNDHINQIKPTILNLTCKFNSLLKEYWLR